MAFTILINLFGGVALLLWGLHMVHTGIIRAYGAKLRTFLASVLKHRFNAFLAGIGVTALLQSSTATGLMMGSFFTAGIVDLTPALAVMLGANVGTTLIVQLLSFDTSAIAPLLLIIGVMTYRKAKKSFYKDLAKVAIGLGLMLFSLHLLLTSFAPAENAPIVKQVLSAMTNDPLLTLLLGALLTWAAHSSVATVLLTMSLVSSHFVSPEAAMALVLGANLGSSLNPLLEGVQSKNPADRRMPVGNFLNRLVGCLIFLPFLEPITRWMSAIEPNSVRMTADFHTAFNVILALIFIVPLNSYSAFLKRILSDRKPENDPSSPIYLDESAIQSPTVALSCAARETLHMGDVVQNMLSQSMDALFKNDLDLVQKIKSEDYIIDRLHESIKLYVVKMTHESLDDAQGQRATEILSLIINLEHIGDIIDKNLMEVARKKVYHHLEFSPEGAEDLRKFYTIVQENLRLALSVFLSGDTKVARQLLEEKQRVRQLEMIASENHLARLRENKTASLETSSLHLEMLCDLKRINSHICSVAYPALEAAGELPSWNGREYEEINSHSTGGTSSPQEKNPQGPILKNTWFMDSSSTIT